MKIILIYLCHYQDRHDYHISLMPVGLISIAAYLEKEGHEVILANYSHKGYRKALKEIHAFKPDVAGVSLFTHNRVDSLKLVQGIRKSSPSCTIVMGGPHATFLAEELLKRHREIDFIIRGEGELAFAQLLDRIRLKRPPAAKIIEPILAESLDTLPQPGTFSGQMIDIDPNEQFKHVITSRGCPYKCSFCCSPVFWNNRARFIKPSNTVKELVRLYNKHGIIYFSIRDDNFTLRKQHVLDFSKRLRDSGAYLMWNCQARVDTADEEMLSAMKLAGMELIQFGVESGSERVLKLYDKKITVEAIRKAAAAARRTGLYLSIYLMTGMMGETRNDVKKTISLIRQILPGDGIVSPVALYPGTRLYEETRQRGTISDADWFRRKDSGIFLRDEEQVSAWMGELLTELSVIREKSWYRARDFRQHRKLLGPECWVTDILEGDYYLDEEHYDDAERCYLSVTAAHPSNPWGYLRMGKLKFRTGDFAEAEQNYLEVTGLVPAYYGGWLKLTECQVALNNRLAARKSIAEAWNLNRFDFRVKNLKELLK